jgi:hypothetical protein
LDRLTEASLDAVTVDRLTHLNAGTFLGLLPGTTP